MDQQTDQRSTCDLTSDDFPELHELLEESCLQIALIERRKRQQQRQAISDSWIQSQTLGF